MNITKQNLIKEFKALSRGVHGEWIKYGNLKVEVNYYWESYNDVEIEVNDVKSDSVIHNFLIEHQLYGKLLEDIDYNSYKLQKTVPIRVFHGRIKQFIKDVRSFEKANGMKRDEFWEKYLWDIEH